ncbi:hypothetical protein MAR_007260 [Mya arenaria]|uniref:Uncharacterized protein n=1 Tax=Mya arenaria TaxID=6604 RepID=A0ABY7DEE2_MYAAR|nr:hypothetical protein MAR_007260 [Mya arenaria]
MECLKCHAYHTDGWNALNAFGTLLMDGMPWVPCWGMECLGYLADGWNAMGTLLRSTEFKYQTDSIDVLIDA